MLHPVHFAAFLVLAADPAWRYWHFGAVGPRGQLEQLVGRLGDVYGARQEVLAVRAHDLALVLWVLVRGSGHVPVGHRRWGAAVVQAHFHFCVVELFFTVRNCVTTISATRKKY